MKELLLALFALMFTLYLQGCRAEEDSATCPKVSCSNYQTQALAQAAFDADKKCMKLLDDDGDGVACEQLTNTGSGSSNNGGTPGSGTGSSCPTTSNCGCSNKVKAQCESSCCKWVVGTGCVCR